MPPREPARPLGQDEFLSLVDAVKSAVAETLVVPALLAQVKVPGYLGVSRSAFFRLKSTRGFPAEVAVPGAGVHFRRADLDKWISNLKSRR